MSRFSTPLLCRALSPEEIGAGDGVALWQLLEDFTFDSDQFGAITAPAGMITDWASIPRIVPRQYIDPDDPCILFGSCVHDAIYSGKSAPYLTRAQADLVLRDAMKVCGARVDQVAVVYAAVRLFGGSHWRKQDEKS